MSERESAIHKHLSNQLALIQGTLETVKRQRSEENVRRNIEANEILIEIERVLKDHTASLELLSGQYGSEGLSAVKKAVTEVLGAATGLYEKVRDQKVSRMLRDDYSALSTAAMGYTAFHTFGLAIREDAISDLALNHLKEITPLLVKLSHVLPHVVVSETREDYGFPVDESVASVAEQNTHGAWRPEIVSSDRPLS